MTAAEATPPEGSKRARGAAAHEAALAARRETFLGLHDFRQGRGLEIGPLDAGIAVADVDVRYLDVLDTEGTRAHYAHDVNVLVELIPEIDYPLVVDGQPRSLAEAAKPGAPYDWVIASHVIEHVPDMVGWLRDLAAITADGAALLLAVPDRRYCFDRHRPQTTVGQAVAAHERGDVVPGIRAVYDATMATVAVDTRALWRGGRPPGRGPRGPKLPALRHKLARVRAGEYVDCHVWTFTPQALLEQVGELREVGLCDWYVERILAPTGILEFYAVLRRVPRDADASYRPPEPAPASDLPDWLEDEWAAGERTRVLEARVRKLEKQADRLRRELAAVEQSESLRVGRAIVGPASRVLNRLRRR